MIWDNAILDMDKMYVKEGEWHGGSHQEVIGGKL